jgi:hypothetical protein
MGAFAQFIWCVKRSLARKMREHDMMPILYNRIQGNGKSTAVRRLASPLEELVDSITVETLADERKRADLGRFVIGIWDEMEGADKRDTDAIKNALSSHEVSYRPMRTNDNRQMARLMNFIGTSNKPLASMIRDPSGNRRFVEIETANKLDHATINSLDYHLLWQCVSEDSAAPAKAILGDIRGIQSGGRYQDSVCLWLESEDLVALGAFVAKDRFRLRYTAWCERMSEQPLPSSIFENRLKAEGWSLTRPRMDGDRVRGWIPPARGNDCTAIAAPAPEVVQEIRGGPGPVQAWSNLSNERNSNEIGYLMTSGPAVQEKTQYGESGSAPDAKTPGPRGPLDRAPWPTPPEPGKELWVYDLEVFPNHFMFQAFNGTEWREFDETTLNPLKDFVRNPTLVLAGFNSHGYDDALLGAIVAERYALDTPAAIYKRSCRIIEPQNDRDKDNNFQDRYCKRRPWAYSIDVFQLLNGKGSLKEWECRIGFRSVVESPCAFDKDLPADQVAAVKAYCRNDVLATAEILLDRWHLVRLRQTLAETFDIGKRAYVLSEQGLAQATFVTLHRHHTGESSNVIRDKAKDAPENQGDKLPLASLLSQRVAFTSPEFQSVLERLKAGHLVKGEGWRIEMDGAPIPDSFALAGCAISLGVGGLHTVDGPGVFESSERQAIVDLDVTSYYPSLMIGERIYPSQLGPYFVDELDRLRTKRVEAKRAGDKTTAEALKIVLNSTFGKLNDTWSPIRSVSNAFRVTVNGQLFLMMLMESLHLAGFEILSANTDGVTIRAPRDMMAGPLSRVVDAWQTNTGLALERSTYRKLCRRDVNAYVAITEDGKVKTKGPFNPDSGKGDGQIIREAALAYLLHGTHPATTVAKADDVKAFLFYQRVKNGGELYCGDTLVGKTARWFVTKDGPALKRQNPDKSRDTIPNGHHITLAQDITGLSPEGVDRDYYTAAAIDLIREVLGADTEIRNSP